MSSVICHRLVVPNNNILLWLLLLFFRYWGKFEAYYHVLSLLNWNARQTFVNTHFPEKLLQGLRNVLQFAPGSCYKLLIPTIITKCCNPCRKLKSIPSIYYEQKHMLLLRNNVTLITKCVSCYKTPQPLLRNAQVYKMPQNRLNDLINKVPTRKGVYITLTRR